MTAATRGSQRLTQSIGGARADEMTMAKPGAPGAPAGPRRTAATAIAPLGVDRTAMVGVVSACRRMIHHSRLSGRTARWGLAVREGGGVARSCARPPNTSLHCTPSARATKTVPGGQIGAAGAGQAVAENLPCTR